MRKLPLQPLRIPGTWRVHYNQFLEAEPNRENVEAFVQKEDMFQAFQTRYHVTLDLGFYPEGDFENGAYCLRAYAGQCDGPLLHEFFSRNKATLVAELEQLLAEIPTGTLKATPLPLID